VVICICERIRRAIRQILEQVALVVVRVQAALLDFECLHKVELRAYGAVRQALQWALAVHLEIHIMAQICLIVARAMLLATCLCLIAGGCASGRSGSNSVAWQVVHE
jgi:hypothetical protein